MPAVYIGISFILALLAGRDIVSKPLVVVVDQGKIVKESYVRHPILIVREGDNIEVRQMKRSALRKARREKKKGEGAK